MFQDEQTSPGARAIKLSEPMWTSFFELHTGPWRNQATARGLTHERFEALFLPSRRFVRA